MNVLLVGMAIRLIHLSIVQMIHTAGIYQVLESLTKVTVYKHERYLLLEPLLLYRTRKNDTKLVIDCAFKCLSSEIKALLWIFMQ